MQELSGISGGAGGVNPPLGKVECDYNGFKITVTMTKDEAEAFKSGRNDTLSERVNQFVESKFGTNLKELTGFYRLANSKNEIFGGVKSISYKIGDASIKKAVMTTSTDLEGNDVNNDATYQTTLTALREKKVGEESFVITNKLYDERDKIIGYTIKDQEGFKEAFFGKNRGNPSEITIKDNKLFIGDKSFAVVGESADHVLYRLKENNLEIRKQQLPMETVKDQYVEEFLKALTTTKKNSDIQGDVRVYIRENSPLDPTKFAEFLKKKKISVNLPEEPKISLANAAKRFITEYNKMK